MANKHTPAPWEVDTVRNEGEYGNGGPDSHIGFDSFVVMDSEGRVLFDSLNRDGALTEVDEESDDEDGYHRAWDTLAKADAEHIVRCVNAHDLMLEALEVVSDVFQTRGVYVLDEQDMALVRRAIAKATGVPQ